MHSPDAENETFNIAARFIEHTSQPVFLTGKAGTGKTTFLRYIKEQRFKNTVVVAPTGVAAINAGGITIHSFFSLPFSPFIPVHTGWFSKPNDNMDVNSLLSRLKVNQEKKELMIALELLVIDEISMVRCDVLDAIDLVLRHVRTRYSTPFGGVQVLYIGDMYQLPPVVKEEEWQILSEYYPSPYFFNSHVCIDNPPVYIELNKVYRQSDEAFINLLNQVRNNDMDEAGYHLLHSRYSNQPPVTASAITLTTHNYKADATNAAELAKLITPQHCFTATVTGEFYEKSFPAEEKLYLKVGAQVMFLKNDPDKSKRYFNGKIGKLHSIEGEKLVVICNENGRQEKIEVGKETWKTIRYSLNKTKNQVDEEELGAFVQYPLRLAWAITIHKSQGLTFQQAVIDAGQAFAPGQVYVALSRCTSLEGLTLLSRISYQSLKSDNRIVAFSMEQKRMAPYNQLLQNAAIVYQQELIVAVFNFEALQKLIAGIQLFTEEHLKTAPVAAWANGVNVIMERCYDYSSRFVLQLQQSFESEKLPQHQQDLMNRIKKAATWFSETMHHSIAAFTSCPATTDNRTVAKDFHKKALDVFDEMQYKLFLLAAFSEFSTEGYNQHKKKYLKVQFSLNIYSGQSVYVAGDIKNPELYILLRAKREALSAQHNTPLYMVCSTESLQQMCIYLPARLQDMTNISGLGASRINRFGKHFLNIIIDYMAEHNIVAAENALPVKPSKKSSITKSPKADTKNISYQLFRQGKTISAIATERNLAAGTIQSHLTHYIETGELPITDLLSAERVAMLSSFIAAHPGLPYGEIKAINADINYNEIRWVVAAGKVVQAAEKVQ